MLEADTGTLYGTGKLLSAGEIVATEVDFETARIEAGAQATTNPYRMFLRCERGDSIDVRAQNEDCTYRVELRVEGYDMNFETVKAHVDDIIERVRYLVNAQMWSGDNLSSYYSDASAKVLDMVSLIGDSVVEDEGGMYRVHGAMEITVTVNRLR